MTHIDYLIREIDILPKSDLLLLWENLQKKVQQSLNKENPQPEKRPFALCKGEFKVSSAFFEPLPDEFIDFFEAKELAT